MATVYLAQDLKHDRRVALKVLRPELAAALGAERFLREIKIAARLQHPHILPLHRLRRRPTGCSTTSCPTSRASRSGTGSTARAQLAVDEALRIAREVADALAYAHAAGVVHRDIKPENILLTGGQRAWWPTSASPGRIGRRGGEQLTETGLALGTPAYMSPEQAAGGRQLDGRSDLYALGLRAVRDAGGEPPFTGPTAQAILARHAVDPVPPLRTVRSTISPALERGGQQGPGQGAGRPVRHRPGVQGGLGLAPLAPAAARPKWSRRRLAIGLAAVVLGGGVAAGVLAGRPGSASRCRQRGEARSARWPYSRSRTSRETRGRSTWRRESPISSRPSWPRSARFGSSDSTRSVGGRRGRSRERAGPGGGALRLAAAGRERHPNQRPTQINRDRPGDLGPELRRGAQRPFSSSRRTWPGRWRSASGCRSPRRALQDRGEPAPGHAGGVRVLCARGVLSGQGDRSELSDRHRLLRESHRRRSDLRRGLCRHGGMLCNLGYNGGLAPEIAFPKARAAASKALALDSTLADAHRAMAV